MRPSQRRRWARWLLVWIGLVTLFALGLRALIGPFAPTIFIFASAFVVGSGLTFLFVPSPTEDE